MINKNLIFLALSSFLFISCVAQDPEISFEKPEMQIPKPGPLVKNNKGSLYSRQGASLFADKKDLQIGDIIQVVIDESLTSDSKNKRSTSKTNGSTLGGGVISGTDGTTLGGTATSIANKVNSLLSANFSSSSSSTFAGNATSAVDEAFATTLSVIIEETYQNGNYFIKGQKEILIDKQKQEIVISGVIRPYDISSDNSIDSSQIANLKIMYMKDGEEQDALRVPWGTKILNVLWPF